MRWEGFMGQFLIGVIVATVVGFLLPRGMQVVETQWSQFVEWRRLPPTITVPIPDSVTPGMTVQEVRILHGHTWDILTIMVVDAQGQRQTLPPLSIATNSIPIGQLRGAVQMWLNNGHTNRLRK